MLLTLLRDPKIFVHSKSIAFSMCKSKINNETWNDNSLRFWQKQQDSYKGVLLGYEHVSSIDIESSKQFLSKLLAKYNASQHENVLDCGAGVGRVSKELLSLYFKEIDILEQCEHYVDTAKIALKDVNVGHFYCSNLQSFSFQAKYSCIWFQWILTHLCQEDLRTFLAKAKNNLKPNGFIIVKENISETKGEIDQQDSTIIRTDFQWKRIFYECQLKIVQEQMQVPWPDQLQKVKMYALV